MNPHLSSTLSFLGKVRVADVFLVALLIAVIGLIIVPMPTMVMDTLIALNITISILLLLSAIYVTKPIDFSTFPSVLLLVTLFRLSISIATTRLILTKADAGEIVGQFGDMVAGGNLVVGLVVFLIITIVQFIVISKGSERVAEVAARFSLDAMPGKQLSIDSDLRSGLLGKDEARFKRRMLELESKLYGSLDGAMKFVKGDAIATIIIVIVNLLGGLAIGVFWRGLSIGDAMSVYSILTIGDGLVAQIPALFCAIAAGMLVTRTTDEDSDRDLGPAIARQITGKPHVLMIAAGLMMLMAFIPGFPTAIFLGIAAALMTGGLILHPVSGAWLRKRVRGGNARATLAAQDRMLPSYELLPVEPIVLRIGVRLVDSVWMNRLAAAVEASVARVQEASGVRIPPARLQFIDPGAETNGGWEMRAYDAPIGMGQIAPERIIEELPDVAAMLLRRHICLFLGLQEVTNMLNVLGETSPEVVKEAVRAVPTAAIAEVIRLLAEEQVPLRNLSDVVEAIGEIGQVERHPPMIAERTRVAMRRHIMAALCRNGRLQALMIGSAVEEAIRSTLTTVDEQRRIAIGPRQMQALAALLRDQVAETGAQVILTAQDLRRPLRLLIAGDMFGTPVISFNELNPSIPLDIVGEVNIASEMLLEEHLDFAA